MSGCCWEYTKIQYTTGLLVAFDQLEISTRDVVFTGLEEGETELLPLYSINIGMTDRG